MMRPVLSRLFLAFVMGIGFVTLPFASRADQEMEKVMCIDASEAYSFTAVKEGFNLTEILASTRELSPERDQALNRYKILIKERIAAFKEASYEDRRSSNSTKRAWAHTKVLVYVLAVTYAMNRPGEVFTVNEAADYLYYECLKEALR